MEKASRELPQGVAGPFVNDEFGDVFGILLGLTGEGYDYAELKEVADQVRDQLLRLEDVAKVEISGAQEERVFVEYNNARLAELGLSPGQLRSILESRNIIIPGGSVIVGPERIALEPSGNFESVDDLRRAIISLPGRQELVSLGDLARITRGYIDPPDSHDVHQRDPVAGPRRLAARGRQHQPPGGRGRRAARPAPHAPIRSAWTSRS